MKPQRVQLSRKKGWRLPPNTVKVDRTTVFGSPFKVSKTVTAKESVRTFRAFLRMSQAAIIRATKDEHGQPNPMGGLGMIMWRNAILKRLPELRGKNLACWCKPGAPCHADVLLDKANRADSFVQKGSK